MENQAKNKTCFKCGYTRTGLELNPETECPRCGVIYSKIKNNDATAHNNQNLYKKRTKIYKQEPRIITYALIFFTCFFIVNLFINNGDDEPVTQAQPVDVEEKEDPEWTISTSQNKMTGKYSAYAKSPITYSEDIMSFPYGIVSSYMYVACDGEDEWAYISFSKKPNIVNADPSSYTHSSNISTNVLWGDRVERVLFAQEWGDDALHFRHEDDAISNMCSSNSVKVELLWYGEDRVYFEYSMNGFVDALIDIRTRCRLGDYGQDEL